MLLLWSFKFFPSRWQMFLCRGKGPNSQVFDSLTPSCLSFPSFCLDTGL